MADLTDEEVARLQELLLEGLRRRLPVGSEANVVLREALVSVSQVGPSIRASTDLIRPLLTDPLAPQKLGEAALAPFRQVVWRKVHERQKTNQEAIRTLGDEWPVDWGKIDVDASVELRLEPVSTIWERLLKG